MEDVTFLVLAGGYSERFGEMKAFYQIDGKPLIQHVVERISELSRKIAISCESGYDRLVEMFPRGEIIADKPRKSGPLAGLLSSLPKINSEYTFLVSCDSPKIKREVIELIIEKGRSHSAAVPRWPNGYLEPLQALYRTDEFEKCVEIAWGEGKMKLSKVIEMLDDVIYISTERIKSVDPELESLININYPSDVESVFG